MGCSCMLQATGQIANPLTKRSHALQALVRRQQAKMMGWMGCMQTLQPAAFQGEPHFWEIYKYFADVIPQSTVIW